MGIWNTGASPIGYAYQSNKGSGINIKAIDPRAFGLSNDNGSSSRASAQSGKFFNNDDILEGSNIQLHERKQRIDSVLNQLEPMYLEKIMNEKDPQKMKALENEYVHLTNELMQEKSQLSIANQNGKIQYNKYKAAETEVNKRQIGSEIAINNTLTGTIKSGDDLLGMVAMGKNPFQLKLSKRGNKVEGQLLTYDQALEDSNVNSGIEKDEHGRIRATTFEAPVTKMNGSLAAKNEIDEKISKAAANKITNAQGGEQGSTKYDWSVSNNNKPINEAINGMWESLSEDTRSYAMSSALNMPIQVINNGKKEYMDGAKVILEIENNLAQYRSKDATPEDKDKYYKRAKHLSDAIVGTAKQNVLAIAIDDTVGMRNISKSESFSTIRNAAGDVVGGDVASAFEAMYGKLETTEGMPLVTKDLQTGKVHKRGPYETKQMFLNSDDYKLSLKHILYVNEDGKAQPREMSTVAFGLVNGIAFSPESIFKNDPDAKIINVGTKVISTAAFDMSPDNENPWQFSTVRNTDQNTPQTKKYIKVRVEAAGNTPIPVPSQSGKATRTKISDMTAKQKEELKVTNTKVDAENGVFVDKYQFDMYIEAPSVNATNGINTVRAYDKNVMNSNINKSNTGDYFQQVSTQNIRAYELGQAKLYENAKAADPTITIMSNNGIAYRGTTPKEKLDNIQKTHNISTRSSEDRKRMTMNELYKLSSRGAINDETYKELVDELEVQSEKNKSDWELIKDMPKDLYRNLNDTGNEILNAITN